MQGPFEVAGPGPQGDGMQSAGPSTSLRYARDDRSSRDDKRGRGSFGVLSWGTVWVTYYAGCAQAQPSEVQGQPAPFETLPTVAPQGDTK
jgi:hypothetical protein